MPPSVDAPLQGAAGDRRDGAMRRSFCHVEASHRIYRRYVVMPIDGGPLECAGKPYDNPKATKAYKQRVAQFHGPCYHIVEQAAFDEMVGIVGALDRDPLSHDWFTAPGPVELSIVWNDRETGLLCKGRIDKWAPAGSIVTDLKTCRDCQRFPGQIAERHYHRQGAMYLTASRHDGAVCRFGLGPSKTPIWVMAARSASRMSTGPSGIGAACGRSQPPRNRRLAWLHQSRRMGPPAWAARDEAAVPSATIDGKQVQL
jgi:hypothetical protein